MIDEEEENASRTEEDLHKAIQLLEECLQMIRLFSQCDSVSLSLCTLLSIIHVSSVNLFFLLYVSIKLFNNMAAFLLNTTSQSVRSQFQGTEKKET